MRSATDTSGVREGSGSGVEGSAVGVGSTGASVVGSGVGSSVVSGSGATTGSRGSSVAGAGASAGGGACVGASVDGAGDGVVGGVVGAGAGEAAAVVQTAASPFHPANCRSMPVTSTQLMQYPSWYGPRRGTSSSRTPSAASSRE